MTTFLVMAGLLVAAVLVWLLRPLLQTAGTDISRDAVNVAVYRDQLRELESDLQAGLLARDQYDASREEIERRLLEEVGAPAGNSTTAPRRLGAIALGLALPIGAALVYFVVGTPRALVPGALEAAADEPPQVTREQVLAMVERLAARLKEHPDDAEGWTMLGKSYGVMGRFAEASEAYAQAARRMPAKGAETAQLLADYADVLAMSQGRTLQGAPEKLIARSLAADPRNVKALALAGSAAFERKDFKESIRYWEQLLAAAPADAEFTASIRSSIAEARERAGLPATGGASKADAKAAAPAGRVTGEVSLAPVLQSKVKGDDTVFVFARAAEGPRMPLAIARYKASDLPIRYTLDDSQAMSPQMKLSGFPRVVVGARVSRSGDATPRPGDLEGASEAVSVGAGSVDIVIGREVR